MIHLIHSETWLTCSYIDWRKLQCDVDCPHMYICSCHLRAACPRLERRHNQNVQAFWPQGIRRSLNMPCWKSTARPENRNEPHCKNDLETEHQWRGIFISANMCDGQSGSLVDISRTAKLSFDITIGNMFESCVIWVWQCNATDIWHHNWKALILFPISDM